jgi:hypothetical protein
VDTERLLIELARSPDLAPFEELVRPLVEHDRARRSDLGPCTPTSPPASTRARPPTGCSSSATACSTAWSAKLTGLDSKDPGASLALRLGLLVMEKGEEPDEAEHP